METWMDESQWIALAFTVTAGLSTGLGSFVVLFVKSTDDYITGHLLSFSAGVMMYLSFADLLFEGCKSIGAYRANLWMFVGILVFWLFTLLVPESDILDLTAPQISLSPAPSPVPTHASDPSSVSTLRLRPSVPREPSKERSQPPKEATPEPVSAASAARRRERAALLKTGTMVAIGISLHNFPEGVAVYLACLKGMSKGLPLALAILCHNIPEGTAVALPIYASTGSRWEAIKWSFLSGLFEPLGAVIFGICFKGFLTPELIECMLCSVAGVMIFLCYKELFPTIYRYLAPGPACVSNIIGMLATFLGLQMLESVMPE